MTKDELIHYFHNIFNSCYNIKYEYQNNIYMIYDVNFIRQRKLSRVLDKEIIYPTKISGVCLFELDYTRNTIWHVYNDIWKNILFFYSGDYTKTLSFINTQLIKYTNLNPGYRELPYLIGEKKSKYIILW